MMTGFAGEGVHTTGQAGMTRSVFLTTVRSEAAIGRVLPDFIPGILPSTLRASSAVQICSRQICHDHSQQ